MFTKQELRKKILNRLRRQKEETRHKKSLKIKEKLFRQVEFKKAKIILFYLSFDGEVETTEMIKEAKKEGKIIAVPMCETKNRQLIPCIFTSEEDLEIGSYGICQPKIEKTIAASKIDLVIVPGVAFDKKGNRLGRGLGYYDRFLRGLPAKIARIGLAFDFQVLATLSKSSFDQPVDKVISN